MAREMESINGTGSRAAHVFPSAKAGKQLSRMALLMILQPPPGPRRSHRPRLLLDLPHVGRGAGQLSPRGCRTSSRALPPRQAAYQRSALFEKRRRLIDAWADHCGTEQVMGAVMPIRLTRNPV